MLLFGRRETRTDDVEYRMKILEAERCSLRFDIALNYLLNQFELPQTLKKSKAGTQKWDNFEPRCVRFPELVAKYSNIKMKANICFMQNIKMSACLERKANDRDTLYAQD